MTNPILKAPLIKYVLALFLLLSPLLMQAAETVIKVNGEQGNAVVSASDTVAISISVVDAGTGPIGDWWVVATTPLPPPDNIYFYDGSGWTTESGAAYQQPFSDTDYLELQNVSNLPIGAYTIYFGVDLDPNDELDMDSLVYTSVEMSVVSVIEPNP